MTDSPRNTIHCIDLFCGLGGLTHGLARKGIRVVGGVDIDPQCRYPYESNNSAKFHEMDVRNLTGKNLAAMFGEADLRLLAGCAPCQPFSKYSRGGKRRGGKTGRNRTKWDLVSDFGRLVQEVRPELVTMENVPQLLEHKVFEELLLSLAGYEVKWAVVDCSQYAVPQTRKRLVVLASRLGPIDLPEPTSKKPRTVRHAISHLPALEAGGSDPKDPLHAACSLSDLNLRRIRASKPGGTWRDWDDSLLAACHRKHSGKTYPSVYGRMDWDLPGSTITTQCFGYGNGRFGHPEQDRAISLREAAILQTFPHDYEFLRPGERVRFNILGRLIGNAVPVRLGEVLAEALIKHLETIITAGVGKGQTLPEQSQRDFKLEASKSRQHQRHVLTDLT